MLNLKLEFWNYAGILRSIYSNNAVFLTPIKHSVLMDQKFNVDNKLFSTTATVATVQQ